MRRRTPRKCVFTFILKPAQHTHHMCPSVSLLYHSASPSTPLLPPALVVAEQQDRSSRYRSPSSITEPLQECANGYFWYQGACIPLIHFISVTYPCMSIIYNDVSLVILFFLNESLKTWALSPPDQGDWSRRGSSTRRPFLSGDEEDWRTSLNSLHLAFGSRSSAPESSRKKPTVPHRHAPKTGSEIGSFLLWGDSVNHHSAFMSPKNVRY